MRPETPDHPPAAERLLQSLLQSMPGMAFRCAQDERLTIDYLSAGSLALLGRAVTTGTGLLELMAAADREPLRAAAAALRTEGQTCALQLRAQHTDGSERWVALRGRLVRDDSGNRWLLEGFCEDITEQRRTENALREAEARFKGIFNSTPDWIYRTTPEGRYLVANPAMARIFGFESPEQLMREMRDIGRQQYVEPQQRAELQQRLQQYGAVQNFELQAFRRHGEVIWISVNAHAVLGADGSIEYYEGTVVDVTERRIYQAQVERQASYDALTGLANRARLNTYLEGAILKTEGSKARLAIVFIDLDQFKHINDSYGHQLGDALLLTVAERLKSAARGQDLVARLGGDEFVLLLQGFGGRDELERIVARVQRAVSKPWTAQRREFNVSCSMGVAVYPQDGRSADVLMRNADAAMYRAKELGRNNHQYFTAELNRKLLERMDIEHKLRDALVRKQLLLHYQPRVDARTSQIVGAEALLRWRLPESGLIPPDRFIHVAEDSGLIVPIGRWVLETACRQAAEWQEQGLPPLMISVNVSPGQFRRDDIVSGIERALEASRLPPRLLQIELTEGLSMHDAERYIETLVAIKRLGVQIAVDDFGTGYSSLNYLKRFPVDHLKVDRSFVADLVEDADDAAIVQAIIALGHKLGLKVVAEGVETREQLEFLRRCACDEMQGFYFGKPMIASDFAQALRAQSQISGEYRQLA